MKTALMVMLFLHALIHFMGFVKAFELANLSQLPLQISKPLGLLWMVVGILFLHVFLLYHLEKAWWPFFGIAAVIISQVLIIISWHEAKFGTVVNLLILFAAVPALGEFQFEEMLKREKVEFTDRLSTPSVEVITDNEISHLPQVVQKWMKRSGVIGKTKITYAHLQQSGEMRTKPGGKWMKFKAEQFVDLNNPEFIWNTRVEAAPMITLVGRDKLEQGEGEMLIKLLSLVKVVDEGKHEKMSTGAMLRYLGEICWFPSAALNEHITWVEQGALSAKATLTINKVSVEGVFSFSEDGDVSSFEALRFYGGGEDSKKEVWLIEALEYREFSGYRIPNKCSVTWKLENDDFTWLHLEITDMNYNRSFL